MRKNKEFTCGIGGSMVWHRRKYGGWWSSDNTVSKVQVLDFWTLDL